MLSKVLLISYHSRAFFPNSIRQLSMPGTMSEQPWAYALEGSSSLESLLSFFPNSMRPLSMPGTMSEQPWDYALEGISSLESLPSFFPNSIRQLSMPGTMSEQPWAYALEGSSSLESLLSFFSNTMRPLSMPGTMTEQPWDYAFKGNSSLESLPSFFPNSIWQLSMPGTMSEQPCDYALESTSSLESLPSFFFFRTRSGSARCLGLCPNNPGTMLSKVPLRSNHSRAFFPNSIRPLSMPGTVSEQPWDYALKGSSSLESLPSFFSELDLAALDALDYVRTTLGLCSRRFFFARITPELFFRTRSGRSRCLGLCHNNPGTMFSKVLLRSNHSRAFFRTRSCSSRCLELCPNNTVTLFSMVALRSIDSRAFS